VICGRELNPLDFFNSEKIKPSVSNFMTRQLSGSNNDDEKSLKTAVVNLKRFFFIGRFEHIEHDFQRLIHNLKIAGFKCNQKAVFNHENKTVEKQRMSDDIIGLVRKMNGLDMYLYNHVIAHMRNNRLT